MKRRDVLAMLAGTAMSAPFAAEAASEPAKVFRLGVVQNLPPGPGYRAFLEQLQGLGYDPGRNLQVDFVQLGAADPDRSLAMTEELVGRGVDAIYAGGRRSCFDRRWRRQKPCRSSWSPSITIRWCAGMSRASPGPAEM